MTDYFKPAYLQKHYDEMADWYTQNRSAFNNDQQLENLAGLIGRKQEVLDLGCGDGVPVCRFFVEQGHDVTGVDFSAAMIALARERVPQARFLQMNILDVDFAADSLDLVTSFYALFHLRKPDQVKVFNNMRRFLKTGGYAYFTLAGKAYTGREEFEGAITFENYRLPYCHYSQAQYKEILKNLGFEILSLENLAIGGETMLWVLAQKPAGGGK